MTKRMLIDATHSEETRVAVVDGTRLMEFDYESKVRKQIKGTIFLAKVTRVEPSLQAAFVNFGGNRHGFLPFAEIHPDYYRIPIADREALIAEQKAEMEAREAADREAEEEEERAAAEHTTTDNKNIESEEEDEDEDAIEEIGGEKSTIEDLDEEESEIAASETGEEAEDDLEDEEIVIEIEAAELDEEEDSDEDEESSEDEVGRVEDDPENVDSDKTSSVDEDTLSEGEEPVAAEGAAEESEGQPRNRNRGRGRGRFRGGRGGRSGGGGGRYSSSSSRRVEVLGGDGIDGDRPVRPTSRRHYKIQEVIKRGQIMLVQASKEERGNKGAAMTTYLSLPGRYCVLMPNSPRGGGVSRKIANFEERKRMREILSELNVPEGMSVIMRTAGMSRTKIEIKRDCDYLLRLWDEIRELTLQSTAPALIHEEGNLIRRAVRDLYSRDIEEIQVSGEDGFKAARDFMKVMMPSHAKRVVQYKDEKLPLFLRYQVESQIRDMGEPTVTLKSGGYLVINPTEALISVDVNSGRATRERHIEETAVKTNLEAAEEVARQLRLRDLGGLVVIDFIDMEDRRNNAKVERKLKESLSGDRARIQMGRISSFGLMELSRQRMNPSLTESQFEKCKLCNGVGHTRTVDNAAILAMRGLEEEGAKSQGVQVHFSLPSTVAIYILNHKRDMLADIERRYNFEVLIRTDETLAPSGFKIETVRVIDQDSDDDDGEEAKPVERQEQSREMTGDGNGRSRGGRGRGRRSRFRRDENDQQANGTSASPADSEESDLPDIGNVAEPEIDEADDVDGNRDPAELNNRGSRGGDGNGRRRGRRGGRGRDRQATAGGDPSDTPAVSGGGGRQRREYRDRAPREAAAADQSSENHGNGAVEANQKVSEPKFYGRRSAGSDDGAANDTAAAKSTPAYEVVKEAPDDQKKKGWWNRLVE